MNALLFVQILEQSFLSFLKEKLPRDHRYMQDNDPKHTSRCAREVFSSNNINWWKAPLNPPTSIQLKTCVMRQNIFEGISNPAQSRNLYVDGIVKFWETVTISKCREYINHSHRVIPKDIELND